MFNGRFLKLAPARKLAPRYRRRTAGGRSSAARVSSAAPKKKSFDRGGPVWPPRSNVTNDRLRGGSGGALPPQPKIGGSGGQRPPAKFFENFSKNFEKFSKNFPNPGSVPTLVSERSDGVTTTCAATVSGVVGTIVVLHAPWILPAAGTFEKQNK